MLRSCKSLIRVFVALLYCWRSKRDGRDPEIMLLFSKEEVTGLELESKLWVGLESILEMLGPLGLGAN